MDTPNQIAEELYKTLTQSGNAISATLLEAILEELNNRHEIDMEDGTNDAKFFLMEALAKAATHVSKKIS